jgi:hypothetical protein
VAETQGEPNGGIFAPASSSDILRAIGGAAPPTASGPKKRGRPPGARNLTPVERAQRDNAERIAKGQEPIKDPLEAAKEKAAAIKAKADEMQVWISEELNEHIMSLLLQVGFKPEMLYKEGYAPAAIAHISKYTELGNIFAIPPALAKSAAKLAAEASATDSGSKATAVVGNGKAGLIVAGLGTLFGTFTYARNVNDAIKRVKEMQDALARAQATQDQGGNPIGPIQQMNEGVVG